MRSLRCRTQAGGRLWNAVSSIFYSHDDDTYSKSLITDFSFSNWISHYISLGLSWLRRVRIKPRRAPFTIDVDSQEC